MTAQNDYLAFAAGPGANVLTQAQLAALSSLASGFQSGILSSAALNKILRQQSVMAAAIGQMIADVTGQAVVDDGSVTGLEAKLEAAISALAAAATLPLRPYADGTSAPASTLYVDRAVSQVGGYYQDTGSTANAYVVALTPAVAAYSHATSFRFRTTRANTGAATIDFGAGPVALKTEQGNALAAGDISVGAITAVTYDPALAYAAVNETVLSQLGALAHENIGQGLEDDGAGALRVKLIDGSIRRTGAGVQSAVPLWSVPNSQPLVSGMNGAALCVSGPAVTITAPATASLWNGYNVTIIAQGGVVTFTPNAADKINGGPAGTGLTIFQSQTVNIVTDGAGNWWPLFSSTPQGVYSPRMINSPQTLPAGTYEVDTTAGPISITLPAGIASGTTLEFSDPFGSWGTNPLTLLRNGNTILGLASDLVWDVAGESFRIIYNGTDWKIQ